jgi:ketosteroid isomerase-like protein
MAAPFSLCEGDTMTDQALEHKVLQMFQHIDSSDWARLDDHFHPNVEYHRPGYDSIKGLDELRQFYVDKRVIKTGRHQLESVFYGPGGESLSVTGSFHGADKAGRDLSVRFCDVYFFEDDKIIRRETFFDAPAV